MTKTQLINILQSHPDVSNLRTADGIILFDFTYEEYTYGGGGETEAGCEIWMLPDGFLFCRRDNYNPLPPYTGKAMMRNPASPETVCATLRRLIAKSHQHRDDDGDTLFIGDERLCRMPPK